MIFTTNHRPDAITSHDRMDNGRCKVGPVDKNEARDVIEAILVGPEGKILYEHSGKIEPMPLKKKIVEQVWAGNTE